MSLAKASAEVVPTAGRSRPHPAHARPSADEQDCEPREVGDEKARRPEVGRPLAEADRDRRPARTPDLGDDRLDTPARRADVVAEGQDADEGAACAGTGTAPARCSA